jgi:hypothetical protein
LCPLDMKAWFPANSIEGMPFFSFYFNWLFVTKVLYGHSKLFIRPTW